MKLLLLNPLGRFHYSRDYFCSKVVTSCYSEHSVNLMFQAGILRHRHQVVMVDAISCRWNPTRTRQVILASSPEAVLFLTGLASLPEDKVFLQEMHDALPGTLWIGNGGSVLGTRPLRRKFLD